MIQRRHALLTLAALPRASRPRGQPLRIPVGFPAVVVEEKVGAGVRIVIVG